MRLNLSLQKQSGSMLVIALFVIVVMAVLGITMIRLLSSSADAMIHEVYGVRAMQAAQSSLELTIKNAFPLTQDGTPICRTTTKVFQNVKGLEKCITIASCTKVSGFIDSDVEQYNFKSLGVCTAGKVTASRTVAVDGIVE
ncbi:type II secretory pathway protein [Aliiglaciecola sp. LCG003]|uniref:pilus assembly PilX family protein n=1 Tax=Aliiglaciecola sp. LCG003 TaxID=3053655 RepID=UPI00257425F2|nr:type II secretory pathway protein [Aliiglaciecola sp. LCG003]WJG09714.1 type II secretory pathway protein [Aliiglaciecola sp. LCG003]